MHSGAVALPISLDSAQLPIKVAGRMGDLFADQLQDPRSEVLMQVIDKISQGRLGEVCFATMVGTPESG